MIQKNKFLNFSQKTLIKLVFFTMVPTLLSPAYASTYKLSSEDTMVGGTQKYVAKGGERLLDIAQRFDIGGREIVEANPKLQGRYKGGLRAGTVVKIPSLYKLPSAPREGIVLNLAKARVFYFHPDGVTVSTYPVGVGRQGWSTPTGNTSIISKTKNPSWRPPASIRREAARKGKILPAVVKAGPRNPLGQYAMYLGFQRILMHGTTQPSSIGLKSSHGCIRMFNKDIAELFPKISIGTPVRIIYEP